jgi:hypothetical protein
MFVIKLSLLWKLYPLAFNRFGGVEHAALNELFVISSFDNPATLATEAMHFCLNEMEHVQSGDCSESEPPPSQNQQQKMQIQQSKLVFPPHNVKIIEEPRTSCQAHPILLKRTSGHRS